ncbi:biopolymer transporter ExbD [Acidihalobacter yilgarnensis]|uniref:Biopolymer transporter ExbD n=1 Tax=Acidihalobacter yilgarnensis TaxID=2819280 RepID=A0A1D8IS52_9GAMM|nr:biopolymer transporter ExbD [Acidihalobacter yilgarnensis]AOU99237.1 biopolymer transporter ExbD [Acidihalobacter yilgarnensis]
MRYFEGRKPRIEIIPMIDIMFFLLVFFIMITLSMIPDSGISSQLPTSTTAQTLPHPQVVINLLANGELRVGQAPLTLAALTAKLAAHDPAHTQVTIAGAAGVSLQHLLAVMDACRKAGVSDIGLAAKPAGGG